MTQPPLEDRDTTTATGEDGDASAYEKKVKAIADQIWKQLQHDLRDERERRGIDRK